MHYQCISASTTAKSASSSESLSHQVATGSLKSDFTLRNVNSRCTDALMMHCPFLCLTASRSVDCRWTVHQCIIFPGCGGRRTTPFTLSFIPGGNAQCGDASKNRKTGCTDALMHCAAVTARIWIGRVRDAWDACFDLFSKKLDRKAANAGNRAIPSSPFSQNTSSRRPRRPADPVLPMPSASRGHTRTYECRLAGYWLNRSKWNMSPGTKVTARSKPPERDTRQNFCQPSRERR